MSAPRRSFYILLPLVSCLLAVLLVEVVLALFFPVPFSLEKNMYFENDPYTGFRSRPLGRGYYPNGVPANANSRGQRDDEVEIPKPEGVFRIMLIGDSFTVGANIEQADVYGQGLERLQGSLTRPLGGATTRSPSSRVCASDTARADWIALTAFDVRIRSCAN